MKNLRKLKNPNLPLVGLLQALGVAAYCFLVAGLLWSFGKYFPAPMGFVGTVFMLFLLVISAAVTGALVFGYPAYLAWNRKIKEALTLFGYTLLFGLGIMALLVIVVLAAGGSCW